MTEEFFDKTIEESLNQCRKTLVVKGKEYRRNNNPMHNFETGAKITGASREDVVRMFALKHEISIQDIRNDLKKGILPTKELVDEKFGDIINYLLIEKASILDRIENKN